MRLADGFGHDPPVPPVARVADPAEADVLVLDRLRALGCDPAQPRRIRHFLYLPGRTGASAVALALGGEGWETALEQGSEDVWLVVAARTRVLDERLVHETRARLERLAGEHGGAYDGWEVETG